MSNFSAQDLEQLQAKGISVEKVEQQLACCRNGIPALEIVAPASTKKGKPVSLYRSMIRDTGI
jgi:hypothetical protein